MKYITLETLHKSRNEYARALFDEKNLNTYWLSDGYSLVDCDTTVAERTHKQTTEYIGWINGVAVQYSVHQNKLTFYCCGLVEVIKERVQKCVGQTESLCCILNRGDSYIEFLFYWELDE